MSTVGRRRKGGAVELKSYRHRFPLECYFHFRRHFQFLPAGDIGSCLLMSANVGSDTGRSGVVQNLDLFFEILMRSCQDVCANGSTDFCLPFSFGCIHISTIEMLDRGDR